MANKKLTEQPTVTSLADNDLFYTVDVSDPTDDPSGSSKKVAVSNVRNAVKAGLVKADVGLGNASNTSDADKPLSSAAIVALNNKLEKTAFDFIAKGTFFVPGDVQNTGVQCFSPPSVNPGSTFIPSRLIVVSGNNSLSGSLDFGYLDAFNNVTSIQTITLAGSSSMNVDLTANNIMNNILYWSMTGLINGKKFGFYVNGRSCFDYYVVIEGFWSPDWSPGGSFTQTTRCGGSSGGGGGV